MDSNRTDNRRPIVETPMQARQAERGPTVLLMLIGSVALAVIVLGIVWKVFFTT
jgi:hypothetical protein